MVIGKSAGWVMAGALVLLAGCSAVPKPLPSQPTPPLETPVKKPAAVQFREGSYSDLPGWPGTRLTASWQAWLLSCSRLKRQEPWRDICSRAEQVDRQDSTRQQAFFERELRVWRLVDQDGGETGLMTGYYEPLLQGSRQPSPGQVPLYRTPADLITVDLAAVAVDTKGLRLRGRLVGNRVVPYWSRAEIDAPAAPLSGQELVWVDDPIEAFFLQVQGSGRVQLREGGVMRVGYADQNGHPYVSIGKWLIDKGELQSGEASMQGIQRWARSNPKRLNGLLSANPSYVFFRELPASAGGPLGALGVALTEHASVAIDPRFVPLGSPLYLATTAPDSAGSPLQGLVLAQDTGGAIRGPIRADYFWGFGAAAGEQAGRMKQRGALWLLWPKDHPLPSGR